jgi:modulator of FtsH protease
MASEWTNFFVAQVGASAALLGLLFVSLSINISKILSIKQLPGRALLALMLLFAVLLISLLLLLPSQPVAVIGGTIMVVFATVAIAGTYFQIAAFRSMPAHRMNVVLNGTLLAFSVLPYGIGALHVARGDWGAVIWIAVATMFSLLKAVMDAWVLLVEINR